MTPWIKRLMKAEIEGRNARLSGLPHWPSPYTHYMNNYFKPLAAAWLQGWVDQDKSLKLDIVMESVCTN